MNSFLCGLGWAAVGAFVWAMAKAGATEPPKPEPEPVTTYAKHRLFDEDDDMLVGEVTEINEVMTSVRFSEEMEPFL